jgi:hypothetical protein
MRLQHLQPTVPSTVLTRLSATIGEIFEAAEIDGACPFQLSFLRGTGLGGAIKG